LFRFFTIGVVISEIRGKLSWLARGWLCSKVPAFHAGSTKGLTRNSANIITSESHIKTICRTNIDALLTWTVPVANRTEQEALRLPRIDRYRDAGVTGSSSDDPLSIVASCIPCRHKLLLLRCGS